jgi:hypothetical protein
LAAISSSYTLQEDVNNSNTPVTTYGTNGQSATVVLNLTVGNTLTMVNSLSTAAITLQNQVAPINTLDGVGSILAYITIYRIL